MNNGDYDYADYAHGLMFLCAEFLWFRCLGLVKTTSITRLLIRRDLDWGDCRRFWRSCCHFHRLRSMVVACSITRSASCHSVVLWTSSV